MGAIGGVRDYSPPETARPHFLKKPIALRRSACGGLLRAILKTKAEGNEMAVAFEKEPILNLPAKPTMRPEEVARIFSCSKMHVYHLVEEGSLEKALDIKSVLCRKPAIRILTESVREFVERRRI